jgi:uncharacterized membrane protein
VSLHLASMRADFARRFWRRLAAIAGCALLVSAGSYLVFPASYIYFGVLHAISLSLLLARPLAQRPRLAALLGVAIVAAGNLVAHPAFDARALQWLGFTTVKPRTEDYVPLFPWLGVVLCGIAAAAAGRRHPATLAALDRSAPAWLAAIGRHSLPIYMLHQPLLIGALWLYTRG